MHSRNRWLVLAILSSALFLIVIDMTVLYTALPRLTHDLAASASEKLWIVNAYALVVAGLLPGLGALGDRLGHKGLFVAGLVVFGIASLGAAFSPTPSILIAARALLAAGAAMMMPATLSIIRHTFEDEHERSFAIGIWAAVASGGAAFGPVVGGLLLEYFWWGSVFLINVPIVIVALLLAVAVIPHRDGNSDRPWDLIGSIQIMIGLIGIAYTIKEVSKRLPSYEAAGIAAVAGVVFLILFVRRQRRSTVPLVDFNLFRNRRFAAGVVAALIASAALVGLELVFSQRLQLVVGLSPLQAGLFILPIPVAAFIAGPLAGLALPRIGSDRVLWTSLLMAGLGTTGFLLGYQAGAVLQIVAFAILGFGIGAAMTAASSAIMFNAPADRAGMAASIEEVSYELGGAIGIAVLGSLMSAVYRTSFVLPNGLAVAESAQDSIDEALLATEALTPEAASMLVHLAQGAFDSAFNVVLAAAAALLLATAVLIALLAGPNQPARATMKNHQ
ncbi:MFS transporter [Pseudaminobacter sp. NGMCC 1.201702]|uniref:MFS transporter n=1 Tax=Pseudaminobacter sp. NGMCC 1.201702 TaxID=3391825 RepID=UPI0039EE6461